jgi:hypothetical protein
MQAAIGQMSRVADSTVLRPNPAGKAKAAYPLTTLSYAATVPTKLTKASALAYKKFIEYAVGDGQTLGLQEGDLPPGYAPLPLPLRAQALAVATDIVKRQAAGPLPTDSTSTPVTAGGGGTTPAVEGLAPALPPAIVAPLSGAAGGVPQGTPLGAVITAAQALLASVGTSRFGPAGALVLGLAALVSGPVLLRVGTRYA